MHASGDLLPRSATDPRRHKAFGRRFGKLHVPFRRFGPRPSIPKWWPIHADANSKFVAGENWHSDLSWDPAPPMGSILYMHTLPADGGDTLFRA